jgi:cytochrome bd-type quinol oxidase subunit 2
MLEKRRDWMNKLWIILAVVMMLASASFAADSGITAVTSAVKELCRGLKDLLPVAAMLMIVIAGVIYAAGQVMGAETRARANVWATAALTGALIAVLIYAIAPAVLNTIYGGGTGGLSTIDQNVCN